MMLCKSLHRELFFYISWIFIVLMLVFQYRWYCSSSKEEDIVWRQLNSEEWVTMGYLYMIGKSDHHEGEAMVAKDIV